MTYNDIYGDGKKKKKSSRKSKKNIQKFIHSPYATVNTPTKIIGDATTLERQRKKDIGSRVTKEDPNFRDGKNYVQYGGDSRYGYHNVEYTDESFTNMKDRRRKTMKRLEDEYDPDESGGIGGSDKNYVQYSYGDDEYRSMEDAYHIDEDSNAYKESLREMEKYRSDKLKNYVQGLKDDR